MAPNSGGQAEAGQGHNVQVRSGIGAGQGAGPDRGDAPGHLTAAITSGRAAMVKAFHTAHRWDLDWQDDVDVLSLGNGVKVKVFHSDPEAGIADMLIKFP